MIVDNKRIIAVVSPQSIWHNSLSLLVHIGALIPIAHIGWDAALGQLGINPVQDLILRTGEASLLLLVVSLACTPASYLFNISRLKPLRRPLGLYAFAYAVLHVLAFVGLDYGFNFSFLMRDLSDKPYILAGLLAFLILIPLAITSTRGWMRRLRQKWKSLHRLVYTAALLAVLHFYLLAKGDTGEPVVYALVISLLLALRLPPVKEIITSWWHRERDQQEA